MTELRDFYNEEDLDKMLYEGEITHLQYVQHHSQQMKDDFEEFCRKNDLEENEEAANKFKDHLLKCEEDAHTDLID